MRKILTILLLLTITRGYSQTFDELCNNGAQFIQAQNYTKATEAFESALSKASSNREKVYAHSLLAHTGQLCGEDKKALEHCNSALALAPGNKLLLLLRANIYTALDSLDKALEDCNYIIARDIMNSDAIYCRALIYTRTAPEKAMNDFNRLLDINPDDDRAKLGMIMLYQSTGRYNEALSLATILIEEKPDKTEFYISRSNIEQELEQYELAIIDVEKAIELQPGNANHYILLAILYEKTGKPQLATECRRRAEDILRGN